MNFTKSISHIYISLTSKDRALSYVGINVKLKLIIMLKVKANVDEWNVFGNDGTWWLAIYFIYFGFRQIPRCLFSSVVLSFFFIAILSFFIQFSTIIMLNGSSIRKSFSFLFLTKNGWLWTQNEMNGKIYYILFCFSYFPFYHWNM